MNREEKDFYRILGVARDASADEIKKAYRKLAHEFHPDKHSGEKDKEDRFKLINEAYETLKDPGKRANYDRFGYAGSGAGGFGGQEAGFGADFQDIFSDVFSAFFGGGGRGGARARVGPARRHPRPRSHPPSRRAAGGAGVVGSTPLGVESPLPSSFLCWVKGERGRAKGPA